MRKSVTHLPLQVPLQVPIRLLRLDVRQVELLRSLRLIRRNRFIRQALDLLLHRIEFFRSSVLARRTGFGVVVAELEDLGPAEEEGLVSFM